MRYAGPWRRSSNHLIIMVKLHINDKLMSHSESPMEQSVIASHRFPSILILAASSIVIAAGLNMNGFLALLTGQSQLVSVLFAASAIIILAVARPYWMSSIPIMAFVSAMVSYVAFGTFFSSVSTQPIQLSYIITYLASVLIIVAIAAYTLQSTEREINRLIGLTKIVFLVTSVAVLLSPVINRVYLQLTDTPTRNSGFFSNPNEAGMACAIAFLLVLTTAKRSKRTFLISVAISVGACVSTFSRSAMIAIFIVSVIYAVKRRQWILLSGLALLVILAGVIVSFVLASDMQLSSDQILRLNDISSLLQGHLNNATSGSRIDLFEIGLARIAAIFPLGDGLGTFHFLFGGVRSADAGIWLGVHNTYLMILGESGVVPFLLFLFANIAWFENIIRRDRSIFHLGYFVILQTNLLTAHDAMGLRFENVMLGLVLGALARQTQTSSARRRIPVTATPLSQPRRLILNHWGAARDR
jgi:O-antigen ligase